MDVMRGPYVIMVLNGGDSEDENEPWEVYKGLTFESLEDAVNLAKAEVQHGEASYQLGRVVPFFGDPDF